MPRIAGIDLPSEKRIEISLTYIFGIGMSAAKKILDQTGIDPSVRTKNPVSYTHLTLPTTPYV